MTQPALCRIDDITVDLTRRRVVRGRNEVISLSALSFDTLRALIEAAPLTANELIELAWQGSVVSDDTVTQRIRLLRKALGDAQSFAVSLSSRPMLSPRSSSSTHSAPSGPCTTLRIRAFMS